MTSALTPWDRRTDTEQTIALEVLLHGPLARSALARRLGLSPASLTRLVGPLVDGGLLEETSDAGTGPSGRPIRPLQVVADAGHFLGVRLTPDAAHAVITNLRAEVLTSAQAPINDTSPYGVVNVITDLVERLRSEQGVVPNRLGISLGGMVEAHTTVRSSPFFAWNGPTDLATMVRKTTGIPTVVDNDVMALTRAQSWFGYGRGLDRFAVITLGVGAGLGLVIHGELVESPDSGLGLIGHFPLDATGPLCPLGHQGCAQAMLSDEAVATRTSVALRRHVTYDEALDLSAQGQPAAKAVVDQAARALGRLVAAVANLTACYRMIITGEGARLAEAAGAAMQQQIAVDRDPAAAPLHLQTPHLTVDDWAQGPAVLAIQTLVRPSSR
ncbi:ROK family transcriptional regulator [Luteococcus peritonei]|uniref:ROK family transcriptional regulator n=1 Tax=Luteococcus peritonei TaxID=88874 RepID=A0ABW4RXB8_9ACTN